MFGLRFSDKSLKMILILMLSIHFFYSFIAFEGVDVETQILVFGAFAPALVDLGMVWLSVTSTFLHFDFFHLLFNIFAIYKLGNIILSFYSPGKFISTFVLGGIAGSLLTYFVAYMNNDMFFISVGASGGAYALLGLIIGGILRKNRYSADVPFDMRDMYLSIFMLVFTSFLPYINWVAHLGGLLFGIFAGFLFENDILKSSDLDSIRTDKKLVLLSLGIIVASYLLLIGNLLFEFIVIPTSYFG